MNFSTCSFSYHRAVLSGQQDFYGYLQASGEAGMTHLHFWIPHLLHQPDLEAMRQWDWKPGTPDIPGFLQPPDDPAWFEEIRNTVASSGLSIEMIAMEKAFMQVDDPEARDRHQQFLRGWLKVAQAIGAPAMRVDPGGSSKEYTEAQMEEAIRQYRAWSAIARDEYGVQLYVENHWGMSQDPQFLHRLLDAVPGIGFLLDSWNWPGEREARWQEFAPRATAVHIKSRQLNAANEETAYPLDQFIREVQTAGYTGVWGIESCPANAEEEYPAVVKTRHLIEQCHKSGA